MSVTFINDGPQNLTQEQQSLLRDKIGAISKDSVGCDIVIEQGRSDKWDYRKWDSGIAECWKTVSHTVKATDWVGDETLFSYGLYWTNINLRIEFNYPFTFAAHPTETACLSNGTEWFPLYLVSTTHGQADKTDSYRICTYKQPDQDIDVTISFYVVGKWK